MVDIYKGRSSLAVPVCFHFASPVKKTTCQVDDCLINLMSKAIICSSEHIEVIDFFVFSVAGTKQGIVNASVIVWLRFMEMNEMTLNAALCTFKEEAMLCKRCKCKVVLISAPVKQSFVEFSVRSGFLQRRRVLLVYSEPPILKTLKLLTGYWHRNMQIITKCAEVKIPHKYCCFYLPAWSLKGSRSCNNMDIIASTSQLGKTHQIDFLVFSFLFLYRCFVILSLSPLLKAILHSNHYIKTEAQGQPLSTCQHDDSISPCIHL